MLLRYLEARTTDLLNKPFKESCKEKSPDNITHEMNLQLYLDASMNPESTITHFPNVIMLYLDPSGVNRDISGMCRE